VHRLPPFYFPQHCTDDDAARALGNWVRLHRIDAVISTRPNIDALLTTATLPVPEAVACAALSVVDPRSRLAGVRPNLAMVGLKAVSLLDTQLKFGERGVPAFASTTYVQSVWQDGSSAPPKD
jgi:LacI family transcriptional regulator